MKIDLNADLGEGCASDAELLTLVSSANIACGFHAGDAQNRAGFMHEAIKMVSRLALTRVSRQGKFWSQRHAVAARNRLRPDAVSIGALATIARAQGGVMRHVRPRHVVQPGGERSTTGRRHRQSGIRLAIRHWFSLGWQEAS